MSWLEAARYCHRVYGVYVSFDEGDEWFECPECGEPILKEDWDDGTDLSICPVCEFEWVEVD